MSEYIIFLCVWSGINMGLTWTALTRIRRHDIVLALVCNEPRTKAHLNRWMQESNDADD